MYGTIFYLYHTSSIKLVSFSQLDFALLVFSTFLIAAAGNIINDYFDVKADRINKPEKLIITKYIKRRWAIFWHWTFNTIAFLIGVYLSFLYDTLSFAFIQLISINFLWFYSMYFKRKMLIGNAIISFLTAMIPILSVLFYHFSQENPIDHYSDYVFVYLMAGFAFILNLAREIIKDIEDIEGDKLIQVRSLPMVIGVKSSLYVSALLLLCLPSLLIYFLLIGIYEVNFLHLAGLADLAALVLIILAPSKLKIIDQLIKLTMLFGLLMFYQLAFL